MARLFSLFCDFALLGWQEEYEQKSRKQDDRCGKTTLDAERAAAEQALPCGVGGYGGGQGRGRAVNAAHGQAKEITLREVPKAVQGGDHPYVAAPQHQKRGKATEQKNVEEGQEGDRGVEEVQSRKRGGVGHRARPKRPCAGEGDHE